MEAVPANRLADVRSLGLQVCVIGIDEGQFVSLFFRSRLRLGEKALPISFNLLFCFIVSRHCGVL